jgi:septum site-determining protein MinD
MAKIFVISSGKGGVGKTTAAINLAAALNNLGQDVLLVDANLTTPNVGLHLGAPIVPVSLNHILKDKAEIADAIYEHYSGTKVLPSSLSLKDSKNINYSLLPSLAKKLRKIADIIIFDSAAGLGVEAGHAINSADEVIIVTNPEMPAVTDALKTIKFAEEKNKEIKGIIINRVTNSKFEMPMSSIKEMLEKPIIGIIPEDDSVKKSIIMKDAVFHTHPRSPVSKAYKNIALRILGEKPTEKRSFWDRLFGR